MQHYLSRRDRLINLRTRAWLLWVDLACQQYALFLQHLGLILLQAMDSLYSKLTCSLASFTGQPGLEEPLATCHDLLDPRTTHPAERTAWAAPL